MQSPSNPVPSHSGASHPLEPFLHHAVRNSYEGKLGLNDPDVTAYSPACFVSSRRLIDSTAYKTRRAGHRGVV